MNYSKSTNVLLKLRLICQDRARGREREREEGERPLACLINIYIHLST